MGKTFVWEFCKKIWPCLHRLRVSSGVISSSANNKLSKDTAGIFSKHFFAESKMRDASSNLFSPLKALWKYRMNNLRAKGSGRKAWNLTQPSQGQNLRPSTVPFCGPAVWVCENSLGARVRLGHFQGIGPHALRQNECLSTCGDKSSSRDKND